MWLEGSAEALVGELGSAAVQLVAVRVVVADRALVVESGIHSRLETAVEPGSRRMQ